MKITTDFKLNLKVDEVKAKVAKAAEGSLVNVVGAIAGDAIKNSPFRFGHNRRSIAFEVGPGGSIATEPLTGAVFSTSGYGGYLETGTVKMAARPYFKPALDKNIKNLAKNIKAHLG